MSLTLPEPKVPNYRDLAIHDIASWLQQAESDGFQYWRELAKFDTLEGVSSNVLYNLGTAIKAAREEFEKLNEAPLKRGV